MTKDELQRELLNLSDGAWKTLEEAQQIDRDGCWGYTLLVRKRMWIEKQIELLQTSTEK